MPVDVGRPSSTRRDGVADAVPRPLPTDAFGRERTPWPTLTAARPLGTRIAGVSGRRRRPRVAEGPVLDTVVRVLSRHVVVRRPETGVSPQTSTHLLGVPLRTATARPPRLHVSRPTAPPVRRQGPVPHIVILARPGPGTLGEVATPGRRPKQVVALDPVTLAVVVVRPEKASVAVGRSRVVVPGLLLGPAPDTQIPQMHTTGVGARGGPDTPPRLVLGRRVETGPAVTPVGVETPPGMGPRRDEIGTLVFSPRPVAGAVKGPDVAVGGTVTPLGVEVSMAGADETAPMGPRRPGPVARVGQGPRRPVALVATQGLLVAAGPRVPVVEPVAVHAPSGVGGGGVRVRHRRPHVLGKTPDSPAPLRPGVGLATTAVTVRQATLVATRPSLDSRLPGKPGTAGAP